MSQVQRRGACTRCFFAPQFCFSTIPLIFVGKEAKGERSQKSYTERRGKQGEEEEEAGRSKGGGMGRGAEREERRKRRRGED